MKFYVVSYTLLCVSTVYTIWYVLNFSLTGTAVTPSPTVWRLSTWFSNTRDDSNVGLSNLGIKAVFIYIFIFIQATSTIWIGKWIFYNAIDQTSSRKRSKTQSRYHFRAVLPLILLTLVMLYVIQTVYSLDYLLNSLTVLFLVLLSTYAIIMGDRFNILSDSTSVRRFLWRVFTWLLILSIPWEYLRMYYHQVALNFSQTVNGLPPECVPRDRSLWHTFTVWLGEKFTWREDNSHCLQYHRSLFVDPLWEVTPAVVFMSLLSRCVTKPVEVISAGLGSSYRLLFQHIPAQWQPVVMIQIILLSLLSVLALCKYRISIPFVFQMEPQVDAVSNSQSTDVSLAK